ncbi:MAG: hypothetical protein ABIH22_04735 [Candidatus Margulisiibacteriota bacterium]
MPRINPAYRKYRIRSGASDSNPFEVFDKRQISNHILKTAWHQLNSSDFADQVARQAIMSMVNPLSDLHTTNRIIASIRSINDLTDSSMPLRLKNYFTYTTDVVQEMAIHRAACSGSIAEMIEAVFQAHSLVPEELKDLYQAAREYRYDPNLSWLERAHQASRELLLEIARELSAQYTSSSGEQQTAIESALVATAIVKSNATFDKIHRIVSQASPELANLIQEDRVTLLYRHFAFHFTREELMEKIAEKGLSAQFAPEGSEQPDVLCFNNAHYAGIEYVLLGIEGFYVKDYLLRVPLEASNFHGGVRGSQQEPGDYTADYLLDKEDIIPPDKIELVDPMIATRAVHLII